jgi:FlaG/FlaF family flagellin (archaellin)
MAENNTNRTVMILAGAVVVLLIAFVAVVVLNTGSGATPAPTATTDGTAATATTATSNPGMTPSTAFDPANIDKKWDAAFKMQPAASQSGTVADFQSTQEMYGMTAFTIFADTTGSTDATVVVRQDLGTNGIWNATWTFVKDGGTWLVKTRKVGMGEPTK